MSEKIQIGASNVPRIIVVVVVIVIIILGGIRLFASFSDQASAYMVLGRGLNSSLQLGGSDETRKAGELSALLMNKEAAELSFVDARAGHHHTLLLTDAGEVYSLGDASPPSGTPSGVARKVDFPYLHDGEQVTAIDTFRDHNIALTNEGRVYTWGSNYTGQLGEDSNTDRVDPLLVERLPKITQIAAGYRHSVVIAEDGSVYGWGGSCSTVALSQAQQMIGQATSNIIALGSYGSTTQADLASNHVEDCTTQGSTFVQSKTPVKLNGLDGRATQISAGYGHLLVVNDRGELYSAGCNTHKQLGRTKATDEKTKNDLARVELPRTVAHASAGYRHSAVLLDDGSVWAWGYNGPTGKALLVSDKAQAVVKPQPVTTDKRFVTIDAAHDTTFGVTRELEISGWGQDDAKAFWDNEVSEPQVIGRAPNAEVKLSASMLHMLVLEKE